MSHTSHTPVNIGLLGGGTRLRNVLGNMLAVAGGKVRVIAAHDPDAQAQEKLRDLVGQECNFRSSEDEVINDPKVDWIFIGSWNSLHAKHAIRALSNGKNVFCEKPLATTIEDCLAIRDAVRDSGRVFAFGLVLRYSKHYQKIRESITSGKLGKIVSFEFNETLSFNHGGHIFGNWRRLRENSGGHMLEKCCHDLDLANWYAGALPVRVASFAGTNFFTPANASRIDEIGPNEDNIPAYKEWTTFCQDPHHPFLGGGDVFDNQVAIIEYANGLRATFHTNANAAIPERRFYMLGSHGALRADIMEGTIETSTIGWTQKIERERTTGINDHGGGDSIMASALVRTLTEGETPLASIEEGLASAITALAIDEACQKGSIVDLRPLWAKAGLNPIRN